MEKYTLNTYLSIEMHNGNGDHFEYIVKNYKFFPLEFSHTREMFMLTLSEYNRSREALRNTLEEYQTEFDINSPYETLPSEIRLAIVSYKNQRAHLFLAMVEFMLQFENFEVGKLAMIHSAKLEELGLEALGSAKEKFLNSLLALCNHFMVEDWKVPTARMGEIKVQGYLEDEIQVGELVDEVGAKCIYPVIMFMYSLRGTEEVGLGQLYQMFGNFIGYLLVSGANYLSLMAEVIYKIETQNNGETAS